VTGGPVLTPADYGVDFCDIVIKEVNENGDPLESA